MNESFSDIFGACIEFDVQSDGRAVYPSAQTGKADWLMGEDCWLESAALRDMRNPGNSGTVGFDGVRPSRYFGSNWHSGSGDNGGVHINSGLQNFFFYLLCEGGSGNNDGISYNITGIGIDNAEQVAYRALTVYYHSTTDYRDVREVWLSAAVDLNSNWVSVVDAAWLACGVGPLDIQPNEAVTSQGKQGGAFRPWRQTFTRKNLASTSLSWTSDISGSWLRTVPAGGTIAPGATAIVYVELTDAAKLLAKNVHLGTVKIRNDSGILLGSRQVILKVGQPDYLTEQFSSYDFDLSGLSVSFTPNGSDSFYHANALPITVLPVGTSTHTAIYLPDDGYSSSSVLAGGKTVKIYGNAFNKFYIGSHYCPVKVS